MSQVKSRPFFWIGPLALAGLVSMPPAPAGAQTPAAAEASTVKQPAAAPAVAPKKPAKRSTRYSATRARKDRKSTRLNSSHSQISYAVFCLKKKNKKHTATATDALLTRYR